MFVPSPVHSFLGADSGAYSRAGAADVGDRQGDRQAHWRAVHGEGRAAPGSRVCTVLLYLFELMYRTGVCRMGWSLNYIFVYPW